MRFPEANTKPKRVIKLTRYHLAHGIGWIGNILLDLSYLVDFNGEFRATFLHKGPRR